MTSTKKRRAGPRAAEGSPAYRETNSNLIFSTTPRAAVEMICHQMEMNKKVINMSGLGLALEGTRRSGGHYKMLEKVSLEQIPLEKTNPPRAACSWRECGSLRSICQWKCVHKTKPAEGVGSLVAYFHRIKSYCSRLLRGLYFSPLNLVPPDEGWGTVAWVSSPLDTIFWGC